jgi:anti-sigma B factor antagonist
MSVSVATEWRGNEVTVRPVGEIDLATGGTLEAAILDAVAHPDAESVVVDLAGVGFLDSSGISTLLRGRRAADDRGIAFRVTGANGIVRNVLDVTGVWALLSAQTG